MATCIGVARDRHRRRTREMATWIASHMYRIAIVLCGLENRRKIKAAAVVLRCCSILSMHAGPRERGKENLQGIKTSGEIEKQSNDHSEGDFTKLATSWSNGSVSN